MKNSYVLLLIVFCAVSFLSCGGMNSRTDSVFEFAGEQLKKSAAAVNDPSQFPMNTDENGEWVTTSLSGWTSGFFPGCLWLMYEYTGEDEWKNLALKWTRGLNDIQFYTGNHDIGFMMFSSYGQGLRLTGNPAFKPLLIQSSKSLASRYNADVNSFMSWNPNERWKFPVIVDNMMNLELMFWSVRNGGPVPYYGMAENHAESTMRNHMREDGSTFHVVDYDPDSGEVRGKYTHQGYSKESCWARGQAWGVYGFTIVYRETQKVHFLETAEKLADYFIANLPDDYIPYWDFSRTDMEGEERDSSAAAIAASALIELATLVEDEVKAKAYHETAVKILKSLCSDKYLAKGSDSNSILLHGVGSKPHGNAVDRALIYGDYYFLEALLRLKRGVVLVD